MSTVIWKRRDSVGEDPLTYLDDVFRYAMARLGQREDAEDIAIETVQALPNPCYKRELRTYMIGIARRKIVDLLRKGNREQAMLESEGAVRFDSRSDEATMVGQVLQRLTHDHREVLWLKHVEGLTSREIGSIMQRSSEAIDSLLQRAKAAFEETWQDCFGEETDNG